MNRGLILRALRESWPATALFGIALLLAETVISYALPSLQDRLSQSWAQLPFVQTIIKAMVGADVSGGFGPEIFTSIPWVHPVILAVFWAHAIVFCTRVPSGEVDRGTIDVLLSLPVTRWTLHISETAAWLISAAIALLLATLGNLIGSTLAGVHWQAGRIAIVLVNLGALYAAVGAIAWLFSALSDRRGRAMSAAFIVVVVSFLLNYLAQFWEPLQRFDWLSLLKYDQPLRILRDGHWPWRDIGILAATALAFWTAAGIVSARRDLTTT
jgi:ABC-2 type transport system permease protein